MSENSFQKNLKNKNMLQKLKHQFIKRHFYGITGPLRVLPDFVIIGAMKCGTTSLYYNICEHPCVRAAAYDEIGFFDVNYGLGVNWYKSMFPTIFEKKKVLSKFGKFITGEDTPFYFWNIEAAKRIQDMLPKVKLIVILRDPVYRAYSQYQDAKRAGLEKISFEDAIKDEIKNIEKDSSNSLEKFFAPKTIISKGIYVEQLEIWKNIFDKKQIHIISTEDMSNYTEMTMNSIFNFLELPEHSIKTSKKMKFKKYNEMSVEAKELLIEFYKPYNEKLFKMIGKDFKWSS